MESQQSNRFVGFLIAVVSVIIGWEIVQAVREYFISTEPRPITERPPLSSHENQTIRLFETNKNSVVYISTTQSVVDVWTRNVYNIPRGTGSGFVWDEAGHIVTNYHVISQANSANIRLSDGRDYPASLVGTAPEIDLAVLKIDVTFKPPRPIALGTSHDLKVGQNVYAIGNPFGLDWTLTTGIVSALDRSIGDQNSVIHHLIQTDAAINPGNSGGPLLDSAGRLIGVNTAIFSPSGAYAGVGFAIPVDVVNKVVPQILKSSLE
ncbi:MAG: trypsin-like peptidase domain-containing protein [Sulfuricurvum sp.]|nr:trypsin-like peptidase domain-containing protein [Sulfuricurvum sp.]MBD3799171.1 trypsin-like peptidase domain-containing protein [Campylobacterota bacterium]MBD3806279.1 trypsin-like peptidase domain-containing protein [Sulfuricurvum sp.]